MVFLTSLEVEMKNEFFYPRRLVWFNRCRSAAMYAKCIYILEKISMDNSSFSWFEAVLHPCSWICTYEYFNNVQHNLLLLSMQIWQMLMIASFVHCVFYECVCVCGRKWIQTYKMYISAWIFDIWMFVIIMNAYSGSPQSRITMYSGKQATASTCVCIAAPSQAHSFGRLLPYLPQFGWLAYYTATQQ